MTQKISIFALSHTISTDPTAAMLFHECSHCSKLPFFFFGWNPLDGLINESSWLIFIQNSVHADIHMILQSNGKGMGQIEI